MSIPPTRTPLCRACGKPCATSVRTGLLTCVNQACPHFGKHNAHLHPDVVASFPR